MTHEHLLNADFDLSLRPRWRPPVGETARHRITDLAWHALFLAEPGDSVLVPESAPGDFIDYLERSGIELPVLTVEPGQRAEQILAPFGWNADASARNAEYDTAVDHPHLDTIARVNGRRFSTHLENELFDGGHVIAELHNEAELRKCLGELPDSEPGWLVKAEHGNAGLGNRRLRRKALDDGDFKVVRRFLDEDDAVVLEHWRPRLRDLCATFVVEPTGETAEIRLHEIVNTADGSLIGALFEEDPTPLAEWRSTVTEAARAVARRLAGEGYAGAACLDAFVWDDHGRVRLRPLVDLNARREMSAGSSRLWRQLGGHGAAYWRFFNRRKLRLPTDYQEFEGILADDAFDPATRKGALATAPIWLGPDRRSPAKIAILMIGDDRGEVLAMDARLRRRLEK